MEQVLMVVALITSFGHAEREPALLTTRDECEQVAREQNAAEIARIEAGGFTNYLYWVFCEPMEEEGALR